MPRSRLVVALTHYRRLHHPFGYREARQLEHALEMRRQPTPSEAALSAHHGRELADARRSSDLELLGYTVFRLTAQEVMRSPHRAAARVAAEVACLRARGA